MKLISNKKILQIDSPLSPLLRLYLLE